MSHDNRCGLGLGLHGESGRLGRERRERSRDWRLTDNRSSDHSPEPSRSPTEILQEQIATLRNRAGELETLKHRSGSIRAGLLFYRPIRVVVVGLCFASIPFSMPYGAILSVFAIISVIENTEGIVRVLLVIAVPIAALCLFGIHCWLLHLADVYESQYRTGISEIHRLTHLEKTAKDDQATLRQLTQKQKADEAKYGWLRNLKPMSEDFSPPTTTNKVAKTENIEDDAWGIKVFTIKCHGCAASLHVPKKAMGKKIRCTYCGNIQATQAR